MGEAFESDDGGVNGKDLKVASIANEVYPMLLEMCADSGIDVADLIRELSAKQQLVDIRSGMVTLQGAGTRQ